MPPKSGSASTSTSTSKSAAAVAAATAAPQQAESLLAKGEGGDRDDEAGSAADTEPLSFEEDEGMADIDSVEAGAEALQNGLEQEQAGGQREGVEQEQADENEDARMDEGEDDDEDADGEADADEGEEGQEQKQQVKGQAGGSGFSDDSDLSDEPFEVQQQVSNADPISNPNGADAEEDEEDEDEDEDEEEDEEENDDEYQEGRATRPNRKVSAAASNSRTSARLSASPSKRNAKGGARRGGAGEVEEEEEDDEEDEDDEDGEGDLADEDEAAKGLAALTGGVATQEQEEQDDQSGLDGLAALAAVGAGQAVEQALADEDTDTDSIAGSVRRAKGKKGGKRSKGSSRLQQVVAASPLQPSSEQGEDEEEDEDEDGDGDDEGDAAESEDEEEDEEEDEDEEDDEEEDAAETSPTKGTEMSALAQLSSAAKRKAAKRGGLGGGMLAGAPAITIEGVDGSAAPSAATSREPSPKEEERRDEEVKVDEDEDAATKEPGTPAQDVEDVGHDEGELFEYVSIGCSSNDLTQLSSEPATDEAALKRQEAMEALTKIEIGFAVLRDKLYVERMEEVSKESEMIYKGESRRCVLARLLELTRRLWTGTHPDLIHLTNLIELRRERRLKLVELWFEEQQKQYARVASSEEAAAWSHWRVSLRLDLSLRPFSDPCLFFSQHDAAELRRQQMNDFSRKRRKLDREKRSLDAPRPARQHQMFETELVPLPDLALRQAQAKSRGKRRVQGSDATDDMDNYVAFPDLRGLDDHEAWSDMERMGIALQGDARMSGLPPGYYRPEELADPYAVYGHEVGPGAGPSGYIGAYGGGGGVGPYAGGAVPRDARYNDGYNADPYDRAYDAHRPPAPQPPPLPPPQQGVYAVDQYGRPISPGPSYEAHQPAPSAAPQHLSRSARSHAYPSADHQPRPQQQPHHYDKQSYGGGPLPRMPSPPMGHLHHAQPPSSPSTTVSQAAMIHAQEDREMKAYANGSSSASASQSHKSVGRPPMSFSSGASSRPMPSNAGSHSGPSASDRAAVPHSASGSLAYARPPSMSSAQEVDTFGYSKRPLPPGQHAAAAAGGAPTASSTVGSNSAGSPSIAHPRPASAAGPPAPPGVGAGPGRLSSAALQHTQPPQPTATNSSASASAHPPSATAQSRPPEPMFYR